MANNIGTIRDKEGTNILFPITHERAVRDSNGITIETKLASFRDEIGHIDESEPIQHNLTVGSWSDGQAIVATGTNIGGTTTSSSNSCTSHIDISAYAGEKIHYLRMVVTGSSPTTGLVFYGDDYERIIGYTAIGGASEAGTQDYEVTVPTNAKTARFTCRTTEKANFYAYNLEYTYEYSSGLGKDVKDLQSEMSEVSDDITNISSDVEETRDTVSALGEEIFSPNLYNKNDADIVTGKYLSASDGTPKNGNSNYMTSGYIPCEVGKTYCFSKGGTATNTYFICYYDAEKVYTNDSINGVNGDPFKTWTVPSGTLGIPSFFRISFKTANSAVAQVEEGSMPSAYKAYGSGVVTYDYKTTLRSALNNREFVILGDSSMYVDYWPSLLNSLSGEIGMNFSVKICSVSGTTWDSATDSPLAQWNGIKASVGDTPIIIIGAGGVNISHFQQGYDATFARCFDDTSAMADGTDTAIETLKTILKDRPAARIFLQNNWMYEANDLTAALKRLKLADFTRALCDYFGCVYVDVARGGNIHGYTEKYSDGGAHPYRVFTADGVHVSTDIGKRYIFNLYLGYFLLYLADFAPHNLPFGT